MASPKKFYDFSLYRNTRYAINLALETHFSNLLFNGDATRIIQSSTQYAFRKRASSLNPNLNTLNFPFLNYKIIGLPNIETGETSKGLWKHMENINGVYVSELQRKLRFTPVKVQYDATAFFHRKDELQYAYDELAWDDSNETTLYPTVLIDGLEIPFPAYLEYNLDFEPEYNENTALDSNRISSISLNCSFETLIIKDSNPGGSYCIPNRIILDFLAMQSIDPELISQEEQYQYIIDHFNETVTYDSTS